MRARTVLALALAACGSSHNGQSPPPGSPDGSVPGADAPLSTTAFCATGSNTTAAGSATVTFDIDVGAGPIQQAFTGPAVAQPAPIAVSDYIYGINNYPEHNFLSNYAGIKFGLMRWGGDSYTAYNWLTNAENNGNDNDFTNTNQFLPYSFGSVPSDPTYPGNPHDTHKAGAFLDGEDSVPATQAAGLASLVTVSVSDYVPANANDQKVANAPSADFVSNKPLQSAGGGQVYQDALVHEISDHYTAQPVFYSLDNEPNYWRTTHPEVFGTADLAFDDLVSRDATFAAAVKSAAPSALVFGPVAAGLDGFTSLDDYTNLATTNPYAKSGTDAIEYYLAAMATKSQAAGIRLVDVLDLHYYNDSLGKAGTAKTDADCVQGPRDFWDPTYATPDDAFDDYIQGWKPRVLIPRIQAKIAASYPGTKLSFSEYNDGCEGDIGGGVAQADILGVFGQYGVFAGTAWPLGGVDPGTNWLVAAFGAFRSYDAHSATVGALALASVTSDPVNTSVYGFAHPGATGLEVVAINKQTKPVTVAIRLSNACALTTATAYQLTSANAVMVPGAAATIADNAVIYTLPAMSVTTLALR